MLIGIAGSVAAGLVSLLIFDGREGGGILLSVIFASVIVYFIRRSRGGGPDLIPGLPASDESRARRSSAPSTPIPVRGGDLMPTITPNLWFDTEGEEAAEYYVSIFPNSKITHVARYGEAGPRPAGTVMTVEFVLDGQPYVAINGGPEFTFSEAVSLQINCADQDEVDYYWDKLTEGGEEGPCGWRNKYGLSWQVVPEGFVELMRDSNPATVRRVTEAMLQMRKIEVAELEDAAAGARA